MLTKKDLLEAIADMPMDAKVEFYHYNENLIRLSYAVVGKVFEYSKKKI